MVSVAVLPHSYFFCFNCDIVDRSENCPLLTHLHKMKTGDNKCVTSLQLKTLQCHFKRMAYFECFIYVGGLKLELLQLGSQNRSKI